MGYVNDFPNKEIPKMEILMAYVRNILMASDHVTVGKIDFKCMNIREFFLKSEG